MTVEITITAEPDGEEVPDRPRADADVAGARPLPGQERAAFFAALRRKADARLASLR